MAEHYGVKPKIFTREWWPYYWMYYKWHTIIIGFFAVCTVSFIVQCATKIKYDLNVVYAGEYYFDSEITGKLAEEIAKVSLDADGNGEVNVFVEQLNFSKSNAQAELNYTLQVKHDVEMTQETYMLYIYDKDQAELMLGREGASDLYSAVSDWTDLNIDEDRLLRTDDGTARAVSLEGNEFLEGIGMDASDLYIAVRNIGQDKAAEKKAHESAVNAANLILGK